MPMGVVALPMGGVNQIRPAVAAVVWVKHAMLPRDSACVTSRADKAVPPGKAVTTILGHLVVGNVSATPRVVGAARPVKSAMGT